MAFFSPLKRIKFWRDCDVRSHSNYSMSFPTLRLLQRNTSENSEKQTFFKKSLGAQRDSESSRDSALYSKDKYQFEKPKNT